MRRSNRKRTPVETPLDYEEFGELESEIKTEPTEIQFLDDASRLVSCCCLCKTSSSDNLAIFGSKPKHDPDIVSKIQSCLGLEISSEADPDAHICRRCLQQLDGHYAIQKQALKCNEYAKIRIAEAGAEFDIVPEEIRVCRFCLKICKKLLDMYPSGESPEYYLLQNIRECLAIEVNSWDPITKICRTCIKSIDDLLEFRTQHQPISEYIKDEIWDYGPSKLAKRIKQEDEYTSKPNVDLELSASGSDCSSEENERIYSFGRLKQAPMQHELVQLIGAEVDGRNFTVLSEEDEQIKVIFDDQLFRFYLERNGSSFWTCDKSRLRSCRIQLEIDATGRRATLLTGFRSHTHPPGTEKLMQCPLGKGMADMNGKAEPFYMFRSRMSMHQSMTRSLILQGFRYSLHHISGRGVDSVWYCAKRDRGGCKARLMCYGIFHKTEIDGEHNHNKLSELDIETLLLQHGIDTTNTDAISEFQNVNTVELITEPRMTSAKEIRKSLHANPQIYRLLKQNDAERNFEVRITGAIPKVVQDKYEYRYYGELPDKSTIWKCIRDTLRGCKLLTKITPDGKHLEIYTGKHSHGKETEEIFHYPLGKRMIGDEPLWMLNQVSLYEYNDGRSLVYRDYLFKLAQINQKGEVRWRCHKRHCCRAVLFTKGNFQEVVLRNEHSHKEPPKNMISKLIQGASKVGAKDLSFKQKLLSYPSTKTKIWDEGENKYETLYILKDTKKGTQSGFIFRRHKFAFASVDQNGTSKWRCLKYTGPGGGVRCKAAAIVEGLFETIIVAKQHTHEMMPESKMERLLKRCISLPKSNEEKEVNLGEILDHKCRTGNILSILARHDPERNFIMARAKTKLLVNYEGEDFRLKSRDPEGTSTWSCNWWEIRKCPVSLRMNANGKQVAYVDSQKQHNHADEQIGVFLQTLGKGQIYDKDEDSVSSYWLFSYQSHIRSNRGIIYQGNKYTLVTIGDNGESIWKCRSQCKVFVRVEGTFKAIFGKPKHRHERLTDDEIKDITGQEVDKDLLTGCEHLNAIITNAC